jgi:hypothetical protein
MQQVPMGSLKVWDPIVTLGYATNEHYSMFFVEEEAIDAVYIATDLQVKEYFDALRGAGKKPGQVTVICLTLGREAFAVAKRPVFEGRCGIRMATI